MIECWKCPNNTIEDCKKEQKFCERYTTTVKDAYIPSNREEADSIRIREKDYWAIKS